MFDEIRELAATLTEKVFNRGNYDVSTTTSRAGFYNHERPNVYGNPAYATRSTYLRQPRSGQRLGSPFQAGLR
jgi:hypothetical protein